MKTRTCVLGVAALVLVSLLAAAEGKPAGKAVVWPAADLKWEDMGSVKGAQIAVLKGNPKTGGYEALKKLPAGTSLGLHTHTHGQEVLVVSGTIRLAIDGAAKDLGAGSWAVIPGGTPHTAECVAGADCIYFEDQPGASDYKPVEKK